MCDGVMGVMCGPTPFWRPTYSKSSIIRVALAVASLTREPRGTRCAQRPEGRAAAVAGLPPPGCRGAGAASRHVHRGTRPGPACTRDAPRARRGTVPRGRSPLALSLGRRAARGGAPTRKSQNRQTRGDPKSEHAGPRTRPEGPRSSDRRLQRVLRGTAERHSRGALPGEHGGSSSERNRESDTRVWSWRAAPARTAVPRDLVGGSKLHPGSRAEAPQLEPRTLSAPLPQFSPPRGRTPGFLPRARNPPDLDPPKNRVARARYHRSESRAPPRNPALGRLVPASLLASRLFRPFPRPSFFPEIRATLEAAQTLYLRPGIVVSQRTPRRRRRFASKPPSGPSAGGVLLVSSISPSRHWSINVFVFDKVMNVFIYVVCCAKVRLTPHELIPLVGSAFSYVRSNKS